jgi:hypothetical protein
LKTKLRHYFRSLAPLVLATAAQAADPLPPVVAAEKPIPTIELPPLAPPANVAKFDSVKAASTVPWNLSMSKVPEAWAKNPAARGKGIKVVIHDTGCQVDHPGLHGMVKGTYNAITKTKDVTDENGHGTWCVGAVHSIVPEAELYVVKCLAGKKGTGRVDQIAHGIDYANTTWGVDVHSLSLGGPTADDFLPPAIRRAVATGAVVVAAAGNDGGPGDTEGYPGRYPECVSVAACDKDRRLAAFSSWGPNVFTVRPGKDVDGLLPGDQAGEMSGTSMACPQEAGCVASWIASNGVAKSAGRADKYRLAAKGASPFAERNSARGYGLYPLDKITGSAVAPPTPDKPKRPFTVTIGLADLSAAKQAELAAGGVTTFRLEVGHGDRSAAPAAPPVVPVQSVPLPSYTLPPGSFPPGTVIGPVIPGQWQPAQPQPWHTLPPASVPQVMPAPGVLLPYQPFPNARHVIGLPVQQCPGGVCPRR